MRTSFELTTFSSIKDQKGVVWTVTLEKLKGLFLNVLKHSNEQNRPLLAPAVWRGAGGRKGCDIENLSFVALDFDGLSDDNKSQVVGALWGLTYLLYPTKSNMLPEKPGHFFHVWIPLSRPVTVDEWGIVWLYLYNRTHRFSDKKLGRATSMFFVPETGSCTQGEGMVLDVDVVLRERPKPLTGRPPENPPDSQTVSVVLFPEHVRMLRTLMTTGGYKSHSETARAIFDVAGPMMLGTDREG